MRIGIFIIIVGLLSLYINVQYLDENIFTIVLASLSGSFIAAGLVIFIISLIEKFR